MITTLKKYPLLAALPPIGKVPDELPEFPAEMDETYHRASRKGFEEIVRRITDLKCGPKGIDTRVYYLSVGNHEVGPQVGA